MANPFDQFDVPENANPFDQFDHQNEPSNPSMGWDMAGGASSGVLKGAAGVAGLPGDVSRGLNWSLGGIGDWAARKMLSPEEYQRQNQRFQQNFQPEKGNPLPGSTEVQHGMEENITGPLYEPQTTAGKYAETIGEFLPGAASGPGGLAARIAKNVVAPGVLSETAGQLTKGTAAEPYARLAGALSPAVAGTVRRALTPLKSGIDTEALHQSATASYAEGRGLGVELHPQPVARLADDIISDLEADGYRRRLAPGAWDSIEELKNPSGQYHTVDDIDSVRKVLINTAASTTSGAEKAAAGRAIGAIDDFMASLTPAHAAVNPQFVDRLAGIMKNAQGDWSAMKRAQTLQGKLEAAFDRTESTGKGGNINNAIRQNLRQILGNKKLQRGFTPEEIDGIRNAVRGGFLANLMRKVGMFSPEGVVSVGAGDIVGHAVAGKYGQAGLPAIGWVAKQIADQITIKRARELAERTMLRSPLGRSRPQPNIQPTIPLGQYGSAGLLGQSSAQEQSGHAAGGRAEGGPADDEGDVNLSPDAQTLASTMTHYAEQPNPVAPYIQAAKDFGSGGLQKMLGLPNNAVGRALQSDAANTALGVMTPMKGAGVLKGAAEVEAASPGITAYHGSPHDFDRFDISKIGTGEAGLDPSLPVSQRQVGAYGPGLYFAENPQVAGEYRDAISNLTWKLKENSRSPENEAMIRYIQDVVERGATPEQAIPTLKGEVRAHFNHAQELQTRTDLSPQGRDKQIAYAQNKALEAQNALDWLIEHKGDISSGKMYQVAIKAEPHEFLDWDKPLSEQSPRILDALKKAAGRPGENINGDMTGERALQFLQGDNWTTFAKKKYGYAAMLSKEGVTEALRQAGIPGIRYLDQGSRGIRTPEEAQQLLVSAREDLARNPDNQQLQIMVRQLEKQAAEPPPTRNYVVFDDRLVDILKKYGLAGLVASGAYHYQDKAQAQGRASGGRVEAAHKQSRVGLAENPPGVPFRCSTCMFIKKGVCQNPDSLLHLKKVKPLWCCAKYDHPGMKVIA